MEQTEEIWKSVEGYEDYYEVSNMGRWKILSRIVVTKNNIVRYRKEKITIGINRGRYLKVSLNTNGVPLDADLHVFIAKAFVPNPENKKTVNHKKGNKKDNRASELEWATQKENNQHAYDTGLIDRIGVNNGRSKLSEKEVSEIKDIYKNGYVKPKDLAAKYEVSETVIRYIYYGKTWKHVA